ncbi:MAG TPA: GntR family transcriptional regulator [Burkholderiaceae bacterium]|nr:GntR family transcriptional regulator [Burkholderiaceae bacterium]
MARVKVNTAVAGASGSGPRYAALARVLAGEIGSGRFPVGALMPTEAQLQARFDVSRHTVREALRELKARGLIVARAGVGTTVRASAPPSRFVQGVGTLQDLVHFFESTRMRTLARRVVIADAAMAEKLSMKVGQEWHEAELLRYGPDGERPVAATSIFVRPEHADVLLEVDTSRVPVFSLVERRHAVRLVEVRQRIAAVHLGRPAARRLRARAGAPALEIVRSYLDDRERTTMVAVGLYPSDRFVHSTRFRIHGE